MTAATVDAQVEAVCEEVVLGVDTHQQTHHAALVSMTGTRLADREFAATAAGYTQLWAWASGYGRIQRAGVESSASYGAGLTRMLTATGVEVIEVNAPDQVVRHAAGKTDQIDAYNAAMAVLSGRATARAKDTTGVIESIRMLFRTRESAVESRKVVMGQIRDLCTTAPAAIAEELVGKKSLAARLGVIDSLPEPQRSALGDPVTAFARATQALAARYRALTTEIDQVTRDLDSLVAVTTPTLIAAPQIGTISAAQFLITVGENIDRMGSEASFAKLCGVAPLPASSGKSSRHRINKGGDRQANSKLHLIAVGRLKNHPPTLAYAARRKDELNSKKDLIRCLKRYIAREVFAALKTDLGALDKL